MKRVVILLLVCLCQTVAFSQALIPDTLRYSSTQKLTWEAFQSADEPLEIMAKAELPVTLALKPENKIPSFHKAELSTTISMAHIFTNALTGVASFRTYAYVHRNRSWVYPEHIGDPTILAHAQLHFDIAELYARKLEKEINSKKINGNNVHKMEKIFAQFYAQMKQDQQLCDSETQGGANPQKQQEWEQSIRLQLANLPRERAR
jgi:hypothetical protein